jgi:hypothetical protein
VDALDLLLVVLVTAACVQDRDAGHRLLDLLRERFPLCAWCAPTPARPDAWSSGPIGCAS